MATPTTRAVPVQIDENGYLFVQTVVTEVNAQEVILGFLDTVDPALLADQAITEFPDLDPVSAALEVMKVIVRGT